jgi:2-hydroxy-3-keto-5-methylthiopentenyl-1-phosphate phosphatase
MSERSYYNTNYNVIYQNIEDIEKSDTQYRKDYLTVFGLNEYNYEEIDKGITSLHTKIKDNTSFKNIFEAAKKHKHLMWLLQGGNASILWVLFNYDHFYLLHNCLKDYFEYKDISDENYNAILNKLNN